MKTVADNKPMFQWIRGEKMGTIVKSTGETITDGNMEFLVFEDGSQCNVQLVGEWLVPIDSIQNAPYMPDPAPLAQASLPQQSAPAKQASTDSPIFNLLEMSKKRVMKMQVTVSVEMPSDDLVKVISDSYENGAKEIGDYLVSTVDQRSILEQIDVMLRAKVDELTRKKRTQKNEESA